MRVQSLALSRGARIWHCCELWCRSQMRLDSGVTTAVAQLQSCSSNSTPSLGTSTCGGCSPKKKRKGKNPCPCGVYTQISKINLWPAAVKGDGETPARVGRWGGGMGGPPGESRGHLGSFQAGSSAWGDGDSKGPGGYLQMCPPRGLVPGCLLKPSGWSTFSSALGVASELLEPPSGVLAGRGHTGASRISVSRTSSTTSGAGLRGSSPQWGVGRRVPGSRPILVFCPPGTDNLLSLRRSYKDLSDCTRLVAQRLDCFWPNAAVDKFFLGVHQQYFRNCPVSGRALQDPPSSVLCPFIVVPILATLLMTALVVWRSKRPEGTATVFLRGGLSRIPIV
uniref:Receptor activity-modifying protein 1 n=1 Tax=Sus scrofa TaxID=9823 RepID=A0A8D1KCB6_PIG